MISHKRPKYLYWISVGMLYPIQRFYWLTLMCWCFASTSPFELGCGHCLGIRSTVDLCRFCVLPLYREVSDVSQYTLHHCPTAIKQKAVVKNYIATFEAVQSNSAIVFDQKQKQIIWGFFLSHVLPLSYICW